MRRVILAMCLTGLTGCGLGDFSIRIEQEMTIPAATDGLTAFAVDRVEAVENPGLSEDEVSSIIVRRIHAQVVEPEGGTLGRVDSITLSIEAPQQSPVVITHLEDVGGGSELELVPEDIDLAAYLTTDGASLRVQAAGERPEVTTTVAIEVEADVSVSVIDVASMSGDDETEPPSE